MRSRTSVLIFILPLAFIGEANAGEIDWPKVDAALGKSASVQGEVHRYGIPRSDLQVTLDGVAIKPALALGGWLGFEPMRDGALVMGDLVLSETEVNPVMSKLLESGIEITALHNHLMRAIPPAMGTAIAINFQPTGGTKAAITGDFVVTAEELNPMIRALRENGIEVTAIHNHMLDEKPRLFFVHFWANEDAVKLAKGLQAALAKIAVARS